MLLRLLAFLLACPFVSFAGTTPSHPTPDGPVSPPVDCTELATFLEDEVMALSYTASFGGACYTIETTLYFDANCTANEWDANGNVVASFPYTVMESGGQCVLASTAASCAEQILAFNADESGIDMTLDGMVASLLPITCALGPELASVETIAIPTGPAIADGEIEVTIASGTPNALSLAGQNGSGDYSFALPGLLQGIAPGNYSVTATDADDCTSDALALIVPYAQCCLGCGVYDADADGICDDSDNCTDRTASNYADPANGTCSFD